MFPFYLLVSKNENLLAKQSGCRVLLDYYDSFCLTSIFFFICIFFWLSCAASRIFVPQVGIQATSPAVETWNLYHWTAREAPPSPLDWCHLLFMQ